MFVSFAGRPCASLPGPSTSGRRQASVIRPDRNRTPNDTANEHWCETITWPPPKTTTTTTTIIVVIAGRRSRGDARPDWRLSRGPTTGSRGKRKRAKSQRQGLARAHVAGRLAGIIARSLESPKRFGASNFNYYPGRPPKRFSSTGPLASCAHSSRCDCFKLERVLSSS